MGSFDVDMETLISLVKAKPVIWDKTCEAYKDRNETKNAWKEIFTDIISDFEDLSEKDQDSLGKQIIKKWVNARDAFQKSHKKQKLAAKSGAGASSIKRYIYNEHLQFLKKIYPEYQVDNQSGESEQQEEEEADEETSDCVTLKRNPRRIKLFKKSTSKKCHIDKGVVNNMIDALKEKPDRHLSFFKATIPFLENFNEDEILEFQLEVLKTISTINKRSRVSSNQFAAETSTRSGFS